MKGRGWILLCVFLATLGLGFYGPVFLANRRSELEVRAWYRDAQEKASPWDRSHADEELILRVQQLRTALQEAYQSQSELSLDAFPGEAVEAFLENGALDATEAMRDTEKPCEVLEQVLQGHEDLLEDPAYRLSRIPEPSSLEAVQLGMEKHWAIHVWVDLLIFTVAANPSAGEAPSRLGLALDLARLTDNGVLVGSMRRAYLDDKVRVAAHLLLKHGSISPVELRAAIEPRLVRSATLAFAAQSIESEQLFFTEALSKFAGEEPICAGFSGDYAPLMDLAHALELALVSSRESPSTYLAYVQAQPPESNSNEIFDSYLRSLHIQFAMSQMLRIELALAAHHEKEGTWPERLSELTPYFPDGVPLDPHTDSDFPYESQGDQMSLGPPAAASLGGVALETFIRSLP